jgi:hypothetical protein
MIDAAAGRRNARGGLISAWLTGETFCIAS